MSSLSWPCHGVPLLLGWLPVVIRQLRRLDRSSSSFRSRSRLQGGAFLLAPPTFSPRRSLPSLTCLHPRYIRRREPRWVSELNLQTINIIPPPTLIISPRLFIPLTTFELPLTTHLPTHTRCQSPKTSLRPYFVTPSLLSRESYHYIFVRSKSSHGTHATRCLSWFFSSVIAITSPRVRYCYLTRPHRLSRGLLR